MKHICSIFSLLHRASQAGCKHAVVCCGCLDEAHVHTCVQAESGGRAGDIVLQRRGSRRETQQLFPINSGHATVPDKTRASQSPCAGSPALLTAGQPSSSCPPICVGDFTLLGAAQLQGGQLQCLPPYLILPTPQPRVNGWQGSPGSSAFYSGGEAIPLGSHGSSPSWDQLLRLALRQRRRAAASSPGRCSTGLR